MNNTNLDMVNIQLERSTVELLDRIINSENQFPQEGDGLKKWNRTDFIDMLIQAYSDDIHKFTSPDKANEDDKT